MKTGSLELVIVVTISACSTHASADEQATASMLIDCDKYYTKASRFSFVLLKQITLLMLRTLLMASICVVAWNPVPMIPTTESSGRAMNFEATPLAAPVRILPRLFASMVANREPLSPSK